MADVLGIDRREDKENKDYQNLKKGIIPSDAPWRVKAALGTLEDKQGRKSMFNKEKYRFFLDAPFSISNKCCEVMKKGPAHDYQKRTGRNPMTGQMASESRLRTKNWLTNGCNGFHMRTPISNPMAFWTEQDVLLYIKMHDIKIASVYGEVVKDFDGMGEAKGQMSISDLAEMAGDWELFDLNRPLLKTTGCERTGCIFCGFGCHLEKGPGRFERLKETHPVQYEYIFGEGVFKYSIFNRGGSEIDVRHTPREKLLRWVEKNEGNPNFIIRKRYIPDRGLGYKYIIDWINEHGGFDIRY